MTLSDSRAVALLILASLVPRLIAGWDVTMVYFPDAVFQSLEPAHRLLTGYGIRTWEWHEGIRWWGFPAIISLPMAAGMAISDDPQIYLRVVRLFLIIVSLLVPLSVYWYQRRWMSPGHALIGALFVGIWFEPAFFGTQALSEAFATPFLCIAAVLTAAINWNDRHAPREESATDAYLIAIGTLLSLLFFLRFQMLPGLFVVFLFAVWAQPIRRTYRMSIGAIPTFFLLAMIDWWTWGYPLHSILQNIHLNIFEGYAVEIGGALPWWAYLTAPVVAWGVGLPLIAVFAVFSFRQEKLFLATALAIIVSHSFIEHKELRYIYPGMALILVSAGIFVGELLHRTPARQLRLAYGGVIIAVFTGLSAYEGWRQWSYPWHRVPAILSLSLELHRDEELCGIGIEQALGTEYGGYSFISREVPLTFVVVEKPPDDIVNRIIGRSATDWSPYGFEQDKCLPIETSVARDLLDTEGICLWTRPGSCEIGGQ